MSLDHALRIVRDEATVFGSADKYLLAQLNAAGGVPPGKRLALPVGLRGDFPVRPVEVLHALSYATSPLYKDDLHDMYTQHIAGRRRSEFAARGQTPQPMRYQTPAPSQSRAGNAALALGELATEPRLIGVGPQPDQRGEFHRRRSQITTL